MTPRYPNVTVTLSGSDERGCPDCGAGLHRGYQPNPLDPGDVLPYEECRNCGYEQDLG